VKFCHIRTFLKCCQFDLKLSLWSIFNLHMAHYSYKVVKPLLHGFESFWKLSKNAPKWHFNVSLSHDFKDSQKYKHHSSKLNFITSTCTKVKKCLFIISLVWIYNDFMYMVVPWRTIVNFFFNQSYIFKSTWMNVF